MANKRKPAMPAKLRERGKEAIELHQRRPIAPDVEMTAKDGTWSYGSPYGASDDLAWCALIFEAFGTRQHSVANTFVNHLAQLCSSRWDDDARAWRPNEDELQSAIALVQSTAPRNEAQAALAAQAVALHFTMMKVAKIIASRSNPDARTITALAKLGNAYAQQLETMQRLQGKRTSRQRITVKNERHIHNHQHIHVAGGSAENGGQPHAKDVGCAEAISSMPGQDTAGSVVPFPSGEGQARLSDARRQGKRGA